MKKVLIYSILALATLTYSCEQENVSDLPENGLNLDVDFSDIDLNMTTSFDLNKVSIGQIIDLTINELYSKDFNDNLESRSKNSIDDAVDGFDININDDIITVTPISEPDDDACGSGSGWKKFGTCYSESCVKSKMEKASKELSSKLESGQCMDLRVKRNTLNAVVCGRVVSC